jgi:biopolymer transport protein TolQ
MRGLLRRGTDRVAAREVESLEGGLAWLATFSAVSPFIGLLGTVWGIMGSFLQIGVQGTATLDAVGPGIAEALITTVCGLAVAIPAVMGYNFFVRKLRRQEVQIDELRSLLSDLLAEDELRLERTAEAVHAGSPSP